MMKKLQGKLPRFVQYLGLLIRLITILFLVSFAGCASKSISMPSPDLKFTSERKEVSQLAVPLPSQTPYDGDPSARAAYLNGFRDGWKTTLRMWENTRFTPPYSQGGADVRAKAWDDGVKAGSHKATELVFEARNKVRSDGNQ